MASKVKCILLIDDNPIQNYLNIRLLKSLNVADQIRVCLNGREALEFIDQYYNEFYKIPDLILLDLYMPEINGIDFLNSLHAFPNFQKKYAKIVFLSAASDITDLEKIKSSGSDLINKPLTEEKIYTLLNINL